MKKVNSIISYENNERMNFFSTQARSEINFDSESRCHEEILFDLESTCHEELQLWLSFDLNNFLTFWKAMYEKINSLISYENNKRRTFFLRKLDRKFFLIKNLHAMRNSYYEFRFIWTTS